MAIFQRRSRSARLGLTIPGIGLAFALCVVALPVATASATVWFAPGAVTIAGGVASVNTDQVTLTVAPPVDSANRLRLSDDGASWAELDWAPTMPWSLTDPAAGGTSGDGLKTVTIEYGDGTDWSTPTDAQVTLDTVGPVLNTLAVTFPDPTHNGWLIDAAPQLGDSLYAIKGHRFSLNGIDWSDWFVEDGFSDLVVDLRDLMDGGGWDTGTRTVWLQLRDAAGNESNVISGSISVPDWPADAHSDYPMPVKMSIPKRPVTGEPFTLRPIYPPGFKMPADAICSWMLTWGSPASINGLPDEDFGNIEFDRLASKGGCGAWTFTLPYSAPRLYKFLFTVAKHPYAPPDNGGIGIGGIISTPFRADLGTTDRHVDESTIPITYLLPTTIVTPDVGQSMSYRLYATDKPTPPQTGMFWAYPTDCYLNPAFSQQGGTTFTFRPICSGPWVAGWTGTYHGSFMRNMYDPIADGRAPNMHAPAADLVPGSDIGPTARVRLSWLATDGGSGVYQYQAQLSRNGGAYVPIALANRLVHSVDRALAMTGTYRLRVRARDRAGNWSHWVSGATFTVRMLEDTSTAIRWSRGWHVAIQGAWSGTTDHWATGRIATASLTFVARSIGWVASLGPGRGLARVSIDGKSVAVVDLGAATETLRRVVFAHSWPVAGTHTISITLLGTLTRPRADVDAFALLH